MIATLMAAALAAQAPAPAPAVRPGLEPLGFLVGHCWRGTFPDSGEQDTHCFDAVYGGQHVRDRHEVTGGARLYRGESVYSADGAGAVSYTYWNSAGGVSRGSMRPGRRSARLRRRGLSRAGRARDADLELLAPRRRRRL